MGSVFDAVVVDTPFGYNERLYSCPQADVPNVGSARHTAAIDVSEGWVRLRRNEHGDYHCAQCKMRIYPDIARKMPFALGFVIREEWL